MTALLDISTDTRYLSIGGTPLTQAAIEQLESVWRGKSMKNVKWIARVVITTGDGEQRMAHDVALGTIRTQREAESGGRVFRELVALRISTLTDLEKQAELRSLPFALLMF